MSRATINVEGGLLPDDLLEKIADGSAPGQRAADFGVTSGRLSDEIMRAFSDAQSYWTAFNHRYERASKGGRESITTVTRDGFVIPLLAALGYGLEFKRSLTAGDQNFNISHTAGDEPTAPPVNIVSADESLDERGSARRSAHSAVQEYLNVSDSVWGIVTNGRKLRLLRNSSRLATPRYIEFDLAGMMESNVYSDFHLLYRLLHRTRLPRSAADASECWLEKYYAEGVEQGSRVRDRLRDGVLDALKIFGNAFLTHPESNYLRGEIAAGRLTAARYYRELLRLVYRLLFLMVAEERRLMFPDSRDNQERRAIFIEHYGVNRLRARLEAYIGDDPEIDLWESLKQTFRILRDDRAARMLGMAALNGELFGPHGCPHLDGGGDPVRAAFCRNDDLLRALDSLSKFDDDGIRRRVNFAALDVEELGSVYESLLEYHPQLSDAPLGFDLAWGSERKSTGSYYTPPDLVREVINSALVPVMEERLKPAKTKEEREKAILSMRVIDPAAGSGHFLLAAARRMGRELAKIRTEEEEPPPSAFRRAVREVIRECIYAVDKNPLAVDLCKVALWIEGHNAGQPLSFLDHHVKCGDSLVGVFDLEVLEEGIPDDAYKAVEGDDKAAAKHYRALNRETKKNRPTLPQFKLPDKVTAAIEALSHRDERTPEDVAAKEREYADLVNSPAMQNLEHACNAWTAAFFVPLKMPEFRGRDLVPTSSTVWERLSGRQIYGPLDGEIAKAKFAYSFFHWPVEFPDVFARGGFHVVVGNPPYSAPRERRAGELIAFFRPNARTTSNSAADFIAAAVQLAPAGAVGLVVPKSFTYSYSWADLRLSLLYSIVCVTDVGRAWPEVLLEQILLVLRNKLQKRDRDNITVRRTLEGALREITVQAVKQLGCIPTGFTSEDSQLMRLVLAKSPHRLGEACATRRGQGLQRICKSSGDIPVLAGKDIAEFKQPHPRLFLPAKTPDIRLLNPPQAVFQNIVAHITTPTDHIRLIGTVVESKFAYLDTVNCLVPKDNLSPHALCALLTSDLINWFVYVAVYNRAVRTMHFDNYFIEKIPIPGVEALSTLRDVGESLSATPESSEAWERLNDAVFALYDVPSTLSEYVTNMHKRRFRREGRSGSENHRFKDEPRFARS
jgi:hypothetical protein